MSQCKTIDIEVPAWSELVFEGVVHPGVREMEARTGGRFGEYTGYHGELRSTCAFEIKLITHSKNPIYQGTRRQWYPPESFFVTGRSSRAEALKILIECWQLVRIAPQIKSALWLINERRRKYGNRCR